MKKAFLLFVFLCLCTALFADMTVVEKVSNGMSKPAKDSVMTLKIKGNQARIEDSTSANWMLVDLTSNMLYTVAPAKKEITAMSLEFATRTGDIVSQMSKSMKSNLEKLPGTEVINKYKCEKYHLTSSGGMINLDATYWITKDVDAKEYVPFRKYSENVLKMLKLDDLNKLEGMPIRSDMKMNLMGQDMAIGSEVQSISHDVIPASTFALPKDYTVHEVKKPEKPPQTQTH